MTTDTDALIEKIKQALDEGEALQCTRVWEAWHYGTMTDDDFVDASDGPLAEEIAAAVLPIVAEEKRKSKAEALREAAPLMHDHHDAAWLETQAIEYETGDDDEHR